MTTLYHLAATPDEYERVAGFAEQDVNAIGFPTAYATRDGAIVAVLATQDRSDAVVAGPLAVDESIDNPAPLVRRLGEFYEGWMTALGVRRYLFSVDETNTRYLRSLERMGYDPVAIDEGYVWFRRDLEVTDDERI